MRAGEGAPRKPASQMSNADLLREISDFCRQQGLAESTFGRLVVNDGKFVNRLREGGAVTSQTLERVRNYISKGTPKTRNGRPGMRQVKAAAAAKTPPSGPNIDAENNFRFYDNRQKYLMFVNTCSENWVEALAR